MNAASPGSAVKWHGGKHYLAGKLVQLFPVHHTYVEPFGGSAAVLLRKSPSPVEVYNDLDRELVNFFVVLRNHSRALIRAITLTPYSEWEFQLANERVGNRIERARRFFVAHRQSIGGRGESFARSTCTRSRRGMADNVSAWLSAIDVKLPVTLKRLRRVELCCMPAVDVIRKYDSPETLFYCDPPYVHSTRQKNSRDVYAAEMTDADHVELARILRACQGKVVISGNPSAPYDELYRGWRSVSFETPNHAASGKRKRLRRETVWLNFPAREVAAPRRC